MITKIEDVGVTFDHTDFQFWPNLGNAVIDNGKVRLDWNTDKEPTYITARAPYAKLLTAFFREYRNLTPKERQAFRDIVKKIKS